MKFKEKMNQAAGFTLVELIVVIAILAILAGVAVPAYSGYITQANKSNDQQLVSEVANALTLHYYNSGANGAGGWVLLNSDGSVADADDAFGEAAMSAAFGSNWKNSVKLSWDGWKANGVINSAANLTPEQKQDILNSSYMTGSSVDELMGTVADLTNTAFGFLTTKITDPVLLYSSMSGNFAGSDEEFAEMCKKYDIKTEVNADGKTQFVMGNTAEENEAFQTKLANLMVFASAGNYVDTFAQGKNEGVTVAGGLLQMYADYTAAVNSSYATETDKTAYEAMNNAFKNATSVPQVQEAMEAFEEECSELLENYWSDVNETNEVEVDYSALNSIMSAVNTSSQNVSGSDLADKNLFKDSLVTDTFNAYMSAVTMTEIPSVGDGQILVWLSTQENGVQIFCSANELLN